MWEQLHNIVSLGEHGACMHVWSHFQERLREIEVEKQLPPHFFLAAHAENWFGVVLEHKVLVVFAQESTSTDRTQMWSDARHQPVASISAWVAVAKRSLGFIEPESVLLPIELISDYVARRQKPVFAFAEEYASALIGKKMTPQAIKGYEALQPFLDEFHNDHPQTNRNIFLMMRFEPSKQHEEIRAAIIAACAEYELVVLRADDKRYLTDDDLWGNICVYMMGCKYGICVFDEINVKEFSPNIPLEYGFMRAMNRRVLLLKDQRMKDMPTDITGKLYRSFDTYNITESITKAINEWAGKDLGFPKQP
jgi:hypothetical protein